MTLVWQEVSASNIAMNMISIYYGPQMFIQLIKWPLIKWLLVWQYCVYSGIIIICAGGKVCYSQLQLMTHRKVALTICTYTTERVCSNVTVGKTTEKVWQFDALFNLQDFTMYSVTLASVCCC